MDVMRAEAEVSQTRPGSDRRPTNLQLQESLIKNALTKNLDDPMLEEMPVIPTDRMQDDRPSPGTEPHPGSDCGGVAESPGAG